MVRGGFGALALGFPAWTVALLLHTGAAGRLPFGAPPGEVTGPWDHPLTVTAWVLIAGLVVVGVRRPATRVMGAFVAPLALVLSAAAVVMGGAGSVHSLMPDALSSAWFPVHIGSIYLSISMFAIAFGASVVYLMQHRRLKSKRLEPSGALPLPSLEAADRIAQRAFVGGLVALTAGILAGVLWFAHDPSLGIDLRDKVLVTVGVWFVYLVGWQARGLLGWTARRTAWIAVVGFVILIASAAGVHHV
jgi:ABC-type transport system involved in cytochrome c biogenesis permease subunit